MDKVSDGIDILAIGSGERTGLEGTEAIYSSVFDAIVDHRLVPGTQLKEDILCDIYGVGRTRIRKVLARLAGDHIVELIPNRGAFVAHPSVEEAREVFRARRLVEGYMTKAAAANRSPRARKAICRHLAQEEAARDDGDQSKTIRLCGQFHLVLAELANSPIMARFLRELVSRTSLIVAIYESQRMASCEAAEHKALSKAILAGRGEAAEEIMNAHLSGIESRLDLRLPGETRWDIRTALKRSA